MARSSYIYIVENPEAGAVLAVFTVKHECVSWLKKQRDNHYPLNVWTVMRVPDGKDFEYRDVLRVTANIYLEMNS